MSVYNKFISNEQAVPVIDSDIFAAEPDRKFALTVLGKGEVPAPGNEDVFDAYLRLRANVYIDQTRMLEEDLRRKDQTEMDHDDVRSLQIAVVENRSSLEETLRTNISRTAIVGAMRVIIKEEEHDSKLPIEEFFKDEISDVTPVGSVEISRYIIRQEDPSHTTMIRGLMHATSLAYIVQNDLGPTLAVVEPELERSLLKQGVPITRIAEPKVVPKYNDINLGIQIHTDKYADQFGRDIIDSINTKPDTYTYWGSVSERNRDNGNIAS